MGKYSIAISERAEKDLKYLVKTGNKALIKKIHKILEELAETPREGSGNPEMLKHEFSGLWSRRIDQKHRIVYSIDDEKIIVFVISARGHYDDK